MSLQQPIFNKKIARNLPILTVMDNLLSVLEKQKAAVLQALPGAGKTTCVPLLLKEAAWLRNRKLLVLSPRRIAARAAAFRMADLLDEPVGRTVGYRVRMESCVSADTRIEVITEGVLTRMLQSDPELKNTGLVIFDEFHERHMETDLGLALCLDMQGVLNPDIRLLVMSATLSADPVAALLDDAPVIRCPGHVFPVETRYLGRHAPEMTLEPVVSAILSAAASERGNILVFLPGAPEIRQVAKHLDRRHPGPEWQIAPLFGNLPKSEQEKAICSPRPGKRKIVLATSIAETSLTIDGIRVVVDSGLTRVPRFDLQSGLTRLVTVPVSQASADQRRGRAGRTAPGICLRLWAKAFHGTLPPAFRPEILETDLAPAALELAIWGVSDPSELKWLDPPPEPAIKGARALLDALGAVNSEGRVTPHGRRIAALPAHPRLAHMLVSAADIGQGAAACDLAALLIERDPVRGDTGRADVDLQTRYDLLQNVRKNGRSKSPDENTDPAALHRVLKTADHLRRRIGCPTIDKTKADIGFLLAFAYPDRIAQRRPNSRENYLLSGGRGAFLPAGSPLAANDYIVAAALDGQKKNARIFSAAAYCPDDLKSQFRHAVQWVENIVWDHDLNRVTASRELRYEALILNHTPLPDPDPVKIRAALVDGIRKTGLDCLPWTRTLRLWQQRVCFLRHFTGNATEWPDVSDPALTDTLEKWIGEYLEGMTQLRDFARLNLKHALFALLAYPQSKELDMLAPTHISVPSGSRIQLDYSGDMPILAVRLQELFGSSKTPAIVNGRCPLLLHLLSPAGRPVQITRDLEGFWQNSYADVKKNMKGRYPKHSWPDDPLQAAPTHRAKPRNSSRSR